MKRRITSTVFVVLVLLVTGFVLVKLIQRKSDLAAAISQAVVAHLPTALAGFPDISYVPIYPNALVTTAESRLSTDRHIVYEVAASIDVVTDFYNDLLAKKGWLFMSNDAQQSRYTWTDPSGKLPWHLYLEVTTGLTLDNSAMFVDLNYGRYPDINAGLPLFSDAQQVATTHSDKEETFISEPGIVQIHMTDVTYVSNANLQKIADFYNNSLLEYGWFFWDQSGYSNIQTGQIGSGKGLSFATSRRGGHTGVTVDDDLAITGTVQKDGRTLIKMHIDHFELSGRGP